MSERIEWSDTETRNYRCWLRVVRCWEVTPGRIEGQVEGQATVEDLRRACEAAGLELVDPSWRDSVGRARELLGADRYEPLPIAARRVVAERDELRARAEQAEAELAKAVSERDSSYEALLADLSKRDTTINMMRTVIGATSVETCSEAVYRVMDELRRVTGERDAARKERDALAAELAAADVPATLARLLDEVEAARKAVAK